MIISASRRTDIPTYYAGWFANRMKEGYVCTRNPFNPQQVSKISLAPEDVDGIVFWTKNPMPLIPHLDLLKEYAYYFQFTVNSYAQDIERNVPNKGKTITPTFRYLSDLIGPDRVIWRYDPIFLTNVYIKEYHLMAFEALAKRLAPYTKKVVISFLDMYESTKKNMVGLGLEEMSLEDKDFLAKSLAEIAHSYNLKIETCAEGIDLKKYGIGHSKCIDAGLLGQISGRPLKAGKDKSQRAECGCAESVDIGAYNTCRNGCMYCYANGNREAACANAQKHDPASPLILGNIGPEDTVKERKDRSFDGEQLSLIL